MRLRLSTWLLLALLLTTSVIAALPRVFMPASSFRALPHHLFAIVVFGVSTLLYAAIRTALRPDFRRDAIVLIGTVLFDGAAWFFASWVHG